MLCSPLVAFEPGISLTLRVKPGTGTRLFGEIAITYELVEHGGAILVSSTR